SRAELLPWRQNCRLGAIGPRQSLPLSARCAKNNPSERRAILGGLDNSVAGLFACDSRSTLADSPQVPRMLAGPSTLSGRCSCNRDSSKAARWSLRDQQPSPCAVPAGCRLLKLRPCKELARSRPRKSASFHLPSRRRDTLHPTKSTRLP